MVLVVKMFCSIKTINDIVKRAHVHKNSHGMCVVGVFDKNVQKGFIWTLNIDVIPFILNK